MNAEGSLSSLAREKYYCRHDQVMPLLPQFHRKTIFISRMKDLRSVALAGKAPARWGHFDVEQLPQRDPSRLVVAPQISSGQQSGKEREQQTLIRRSHPLYATTTLRLLTEIMNGRLFTTVSPFICNLLHSMVVCMSTSRIQICPHSCKAMCM